MRYNKEERLKIGHKIYESGMSYVEAGVIYGISDETARRYQIFYEESNSLSHHTKKSLPDKLSAESISQNAEPISSTTNYEDMTKEELLQELLHNNKSILLSAYYNHKIIKEPQKYAHSYYITMQQICLHAIYILPCQHFPSKFILQKG